jgi:two-component system chemotaxis sensor kinase CheA
MDPAFISRRAVEKGLISPTQAKAMRPADALQLICFPGFSTAAQVTEISGRGVGMDVVKSAMENLGGVLAIDSAPGQGTRFRLKLPLSVAIINLLLVECAGHRIGIPFTRLLRAQEIDRSEISTRGRQAVATIGEEEVPLLSLRKILGLPAQAPGAAVPIVLTEARHRRVALVVDRLAGQRQAFVKTLGFPLDHLPGVSGATVLGDGSVIFIIDPQTLLDGRPSRPPGGKECGHELQPADGRAA